MAATSRSLIVPTARGSRYRKRVALSALNVLDTVKRGSPSSPSVARHALPLLA
jgi:hypothetical protein